MTTNNGSLYWPPEALNAIRFIKTNLHKNVWIIGIRALYGQGVPIYRGTEDIDLYVALTKQERDILSSHLRAQFGRISTLWTKFGVSYIFPSGYRLDINTTNRYINTHGLSTDRLHIGQGVYVSVPSVEDIILLKLLAPQKKHVRDIMHVLRTTPVNIPLLLSEAKKLGLERKLIKELKVSGAMKKSRGQFAQYKL